MEKGPDAARANPFLMRQRWNLDEDGHAPARPIEALPAIVEKRNCVC